MGRPKAAVELDGEPLVRRGARALVTAGLAPVVVVLGAGLPGTADLLDEGTTWVPAPGWDTEGQAASLRAGLAALEATDAVAALVALVDTPGIGPDALARVAAHAQGPEVLARGTVDGRAGHPVLLGRAHWKAVRAAATGDAGARGFLRGRDDVAAVEIGDVAVEDDLDTPEDLQRWTAREETPR
ncbi:nicotine blue oxidoreductase [Actinomycetospora succinea]|uniref:Nicotine blue oxidoreductase n=1 Tax=Actinomycetospora succinea TaxID=663603 RepID=A0A4R6VS92_9PSEU|nr:nicotine blue oxidoreductase [Actinomycetospora succinea]